MKWLIAERYTNMTCFVGSGLRAKAVSNAQMKQKNYSTQPLLLEIRNTSNRA